MNLFLFIIHALQIQLTHYDFCSLIWTQILWIVHNKYKQIWLNPLRFDWNRQFTLQLLVFDGILKIHFWKCLYLKSSSSSSSSIGTLSENEFNLSAQTIVISSLFIGINRLNTRQKASSNTTKHEETNNWQLVIYTTLVAMHKLSAWNYDKTSNSTEAKRKN